MSLRRSFIAVLAVSLSACAGVQQGGLPKTPLSPVVSTNGVPAPVLPERFASLPSALLENVAPQHPELVADWALPLRQKARSPLSTERVGDPGFLVGMQTPQSISTIFANITSYTTSQFTLKYPPSGSKVAPASPPERFFGPEIEPGSSCLLAGMAYVNFGPGGTQRNGPGNPIQFLVGPYNAFRVIDLCTLDAKGSPTFFLTPISPTFVANYVRLISGTPFIAVGVGSNSSHAATNPTAHWYVVIYNFRLQQWQVAHQSVGNVGPSIGDVAAYPGTRNLPEVCPVLHALIARDVSVLNPNTGFFEAATSTVAPTIKPGDFGGSLACFRADSTGPASYNFYRIGAEWVLRELTQ